MKSAEFPVDIPCGSAFLNLFFNGCRSRFGRDCTNLSVCKKPIISTTATRFRILFVILTFSLQIVEITSSGGVPNNSVMIEN